VQLNAVTFGPESGRPVVALHGLTGHAERYRQLAEVALPRRRVVALDLRGHGRSTWLPPWGVAQHVEDLIETAAGLGLSGAAWVGHSFGGRLVAELAAVRPELVERAVLLDPALQLAVGVADERAVLAMSDVSFGSPEDSVDARLADGSLFSTPGDVLEREAAEHLVRGADGRWRWRYRREAAVVAWSEMASPAPPWPTCPTLVVLGERSWIPVDVTSGAAIEVVHVPGGHSVLWDDFEATAAAVAAFLERED
jgi:lipase